MAKEGQYVTIRCQVVKIRKIHRLMYEVAATLKLLVGKLVVLAGLAIWLQ